MKKIFIYYSLTGNGDEVARVLKQKGYEVKRIKTMEELPKNNVLRILSGGFKALIGYKDKIEELDINFDDYDVITIGTPIWNSRVSSPVNRILSNLKTDKMINFILWSASGKASVAMKKLELKYPNSKFITLKEPKSNIEELKKIQAVKS